MKNRQYPFYNSDSFQTVRELLDIAEKKYGERDAYIYKIRKNTYKKTYAEFISEVHALARYFIKEGYTSQRIAILGENSYEWIVTWFAVVISGNTAVPLDKMLSEEQLKFVLADTGASLLIYSNQFAEYVPSFKAANELLKEICMEKDLQSCLESGKAALMAENKTAIDVKIKPSDTAIIIYTSGTTGIAKGVMLSHSNLCSDAMGVSKHAESSGNNLFVLPLNHAYAIIALLVVINKGKASCINSGLKRFAAEIKEYKPHEMYLVPLIVENLYSKIMDKAKSEGKLKQLKFLMKVSLFLYSIGIDVRRKLFARVLSEFGGKLEILICGGAALDPDYVKAFRAFGINILIGYGISECSPVISVNRNNHYRDGSVGLPLSGVEVKTDAADGRSEGELYVRGGIIMKGYWNNKKATEETFDGEWFKTGDIGYIDKDGFIYITGRKKNVIILSNGKNLYPEELEMQLVKLPAIAEVLVYEENKAVTAEIFPDEDYIIENEIADINEHIEALVEKFNKQLPACKSITAVKLRNTCFEKTSTKKIIRKRIAS